MDEIMNGTQLYPVFDRPPECPLNLFRLLKGRKTGEWRPPKRGEYYVSGAIPECYRAVNDMTWNASIVELVIAIPTDQYKVEVYHG